MRFHGQDDLRRMAGQISKHYGSHFGAENLVNYGQTVIVKPGARTINGILVTGAGVAQALGASNDVHPMAVTYGFQHSIVESAENFERGIMSELDAAESDVDSAPDSGEVFGFDSFFDASTPMEAPRYAVRMRTRYLNISRRFGRFAVSAVAYQRGRDRRVAARVFKRIQRLWGRMQSRGVPLDGLLSPQSLRDRVYAAARQLVRSTSAVTPGPGMSTAPVSMSPVPLAFDQGALERSVGLRTTGNLLAQQISSSTFGSESSLSADTRAETLGYLFGGMEHDYYGIIGEPFNIVLAEEDETVLDDEASDLEDESALTSEIESALAEDDAAGAEEPSSEEGAAVEDEGLPEDDSDLDEPARGEDSVDEDLPEDDSDLEEGSDESDEGLPEDDSDLDDDSAESAPSKKSPDSVSRAVASAVKDAAKDVDAIITEVKRVVVIPASESHASSLSKARTTLNTKLSKIQPDAASKAAEGGVAVANRVKSLAEKVQKIDSALKEASPNGSINYGALVPASSQAKDKIVVIAIKKNKDGNMDPDRKAIMGLAAQAGFVSDGHPLDVFGADIISSMASGGYTPSEAYFMLDQATEPADYMGVMSGTMTVADAMGVFGAYLSGFNAESDDVISEDDFGINEFGDAEPKFEAKRKQYEHRLGRYQKFKAAGNQAGAAEVLGRMKKLWAKMTDKQRKGFPSPDSLAVPGVEIAKQASPKAAQINAKIEAKSAVIEAETEKTAGSINRAYGFDDEDLYGDDADLLYGLDEADEMDEDAEAAEGASYGVLIATPLKYSRNVKQFLNRIQKGSTKYAAKDWKALNEVWDKLSPAKRTGLKKPEFALKEAAKINLTATSVATGRRIEALEALVGNKDPVGGSKALYGVAMSGMYGEDDLDDDLGGDLDDDLDGDEGDEGGEIDAIASQYMARYSGSAAAFPQGQSAPFPGPRMSGREVY